MSFDQTFFIVLLLRLLYCQCGFIISPHPHPSFLSAVYGKPVLPSSAPASPIPFQHQGSREEPDRDGDPEGPPNPPPAVENIPRPLSPTKLTPVAHSPLRYQSDADLEVLRRKLANAPRPLKKRSSITEPEGPSGPNIQKLLYQRFNTLAGGMESGVGPVPPFYQPDNPLSYMGLDTANGNLMDAGVLPAPVAEAPAPGPVPVRVSPPPPADDNENRLAHPAGRTGPPQPPDAAAPAPNDRPEDSQNNNQNNHSQGAETPPSPAPQTPPAEEEPAQQPGSTAAVSNTRSEAAAQTQRREKYTIQSQNFLRNSSTFSTLYTNTGEEILQIHH